MNVSCCSLLRLSPWLTLSARGAVLGIDADCRKLLQEKTVAEVALICTSLLPAFTISSCSCLCRNSTDHSAVVTSFLPSFKYIFQETPPSLCIASSGSGKNNPNWSYSKSPLMQTQNWRVWGKEKPELWDRRSIACALLLQVYRRLFKLWKTELLSLSH